MILPELIGRYFSHLVEISNREPGIRSIELLVQIAELRGKIGCCVSAKLFYKS